MLAWILNNWLLLIGVALPATIVVLVWLLRSKGTMYSRIGRSAEPIDFRVETVRNVPMGTGGEITISDIVLGKTKEEKPEWYEVLQAELDRLPVGKVVFNPPDTMKLGVKERIETRISRDVNADLKISLRGRGIPQIEELKISELMKVRLSGSDFDIIPLNEEEQIIEATEFTEWAWDVTPKKSGKKILHLHITLRIRLPFGEERKDHPVLEREIVVRVNPVYSVKSFIFTYWKWIVTALILPLIGWVWETYIK